MSERTIIHIEEDEESGGLKVDAHGPASVMFAAANALIEMAVRGIIADQVKALVADQVKNGPKLILTRKN